MRASADFTTSHALEPEYRESHFSFRKLDPKSEPPAEFQHSWDCLRLTTSVMRVI